MVPLLLLPGLLLVPQAASATLITASPASTFGNLICSSFQSAGKHALSPKAPRRDSLYNLGRPGAITWANALIPLNNVGGPKQAFTAPVRCDAGQFERRLDNGFGPRVGYSTHPRRAS